MSDLLRLSVQKIFIPKYSMEFALSKSSQLEREIFWIFLAGDFQAEATIKTLKIKSQKHKVPEVKM